MRMQLLECIEAQANGWDIESEALDWCIRCSDGGLSDADRSRFQAWLSRSSAHRVAYENAQELWKDVGELSDLRGAAKLEDLDELSFEDPPCEAVAAKARKPAREEGFKRTLAQAGGLAAIAASILLGLVFFGGQNDVGPGAYRLTTEVAELRVHHLPDGSRITIGPRSVMEIRYSDTARMVRLMSGKGFFSVAHNPARPFEVSVGGTSVRALGTDFEVRQAVNRVYVAVAEGAVEVRMKHNQKARRDVDRPASPETVRVNAGQKVFAEMTNVSNVQPVNPAALGAWRNGHLFYDNVRLIDVVDDVNRYYAGRVELLDPELGEMRITASFNALGIAEKLESLEAILPVEVRRPAPDRVVIARRNDRG